MILLSCDPLEISESQFTVSTIEKRIAIVDSYVQNFQASFIASRKRPILTWLTKNEFNFCPETRRGSLTAESPWVSRAEHYYSILMTNTCRPYSALGRCPNLSVASLYKLQVYEYSPIWFQTKRVLFFVRKTYFYLQLTRRKTNICILRTWVFIRGLKAHLRFVTILCYYRSVCSNNIMIIKLPLQQDSNWFSVCINWQHI